MKSTLIFFALLIPVLAWPQSARNRAVQIFDLKENAWISEINPLPIENSGPFLSTFVKWEESGNVLISIRLSKDGENWGDWQTFIRDEHADPGVNISELMFIEPEIRFFQLGKIGKMAAPVTIHFYNPGFTPEKTPENPVYALNPVDECTCPMPDYQNRNQWCPSGDCPPNPNPSYTTVTHLIVHHSAGGNTSSDWAAVVRSIWDLHVNGNGWADIGYNYLVDPNGVIYEGRGNNVLGAHFCGTNGQTMGTCVMGNFTEVTPTENALSSLTALLAWKACDRDIDPQGTLFHPSSGLNLRQISGHRDGCATECPGNAFYPLLQDVRDGVSDYQQTVCSILAAGEPADPAPFTVFPNPVRDLITLQSAAAAPAAFDLEILDARGRVVRHVGFSAGSGLEIPVSNLASGLYYLHWQSSRSAGFQKFIKIE